MNSEYDEQLNYEEEFHSKETKLFRKERKRAADGDRSKYKKTDQAQLKKNLQLPIEEKGLRGRVLAILPDGTKVEHKGKSYLCGLKGTLKKEKNRSKNIIAVGDFVRFEERPGDEGLIISVEPRRSILSRADNLHRRKEQLIAVNVDQVIITASVHQPNLKPFLIDRYIIAAKKGNMEPIIVINKIDSLQKETEEDIILQECEPAYRELGIPFLLVSSYTGEGIDELKNLMKNKSSVFSGQSGVGKSSLINAVTGLNLKTGDVVYKTLKGSHTTTTTQLIPLEGGGFCVDTPGIKSFGIWELEASEIQQYFSEIAAAACKCKFPDCSHQTETDCAVKEEVENEKISPVRFASYCALIETALSKHRSR